MDNHGRERGRARIVPRHPLPVWRRDSLVISIDSADLEDLIASALARHGRDDAAARLVSHALVEAERVGSPEFGLSLLVAAAVRDWAPAPVSSHGAISSLDAGGRFAPLVVAEAALHSARTANADGIGMTVVVSPGGLGRIAPYARAIADAGVLGLIAVGAPPLVAPHDGTAAALGTNPVAVAFPTEGSPIVLDAASSAITRGRWSRIRSEGGDLPDGVAIDSDGEPTTDPDLVGAFLPRGGLAGTALALVVEALTNGVAGVPGSSSDRRAAMVMAVRSLAIDVDAAAVGEDLRARLEAAGGHVPGSRAPRHPGPLEIDAGLLRALGA